MLIGDLARSAGVKVSTIRFYERRGLLERPQRRESGYREYAEEASEWVRFIRQAQELGFTLEDIRELMRLQSTVGLSADVKERAARRLEDVRAKLAALMQVERSLAILVAQCPGAGIIEACPIIQTIQNP